MDLPAMPVLPCSFMARGDPGDTQIEAFLPVGFDVVDGDSAAGGPPETDPGRDQWSVVHAWFG